MSIDQSLNNRAMAHRRTVDRGKNLSILKDKSQKYDELLIDKLTELPSGLALKELIANFDRTKYPPGYQIVAIEFDLKGVKAVNDTLGHAVGDEYIRECANALAHSFRVKDTEEDAMFHLPDDISEIGIHRQHVDGDEFVVLFVCPPDMTDSIEEIITNRLTKTKQNTLSRITGKPIDFRYGISQQPIPDQSVSNQEFFDSLINKADENLNLSRQKEAHPNER